MPSVFWGSIILSKINIGADFMFNRFKDDLKKYWKYAIYSSKAQLKSEIANSYLNWLWWVLDPLCFMLIYVFMFGYVFKSNQQYFAIFVFIGITLWDFFNKSLLQSVKVIKANKPIVSKVYIPKFILLFVKMGVNGFKMCISLLIILAMMLVFRVPVTWNVLYFIPILMTLIVIVFGFSCFLLHYGVFVEDLCAAFPVLSDRCILEYHGQAPGTLQRLYRKGKPYCVFVDCLP